MPKKLTKNEPKAKLNKTVKSEPKKKLSVMWPINKPLDEPVDESDNEPINEPKPKPKSSKESEEESEYNKLMRRIEKFKDDRLQQNMEDEHFARFKAIKNKDEKLQQQMEEENDEIISRLSRLNKVIIHDKINEELLDPDYELYDEIQDME